MSDEILGMGDKISATMVCGAGQEDKVEVDGFYTATCYDANGNAGIINIRLKKGKSDGRIKQSVAGQKLFGLFGI